MGVLPLSVRHGERPVGHTTILEVLAGSGARIEADVGVSGLAYRSENVRSGDAFFCIPGFAHDGHDFATDAVARGAAVLVVQRRLKDLPVPQAVVPDARIALSRAASAFFGHPSHDVAVVGITGTNGKTTTVYLVDCIMAAAGRVTGLIGTVETRIGEDRMRAGRTTPESLDLHSLLARMRDAGVTACGMEVSSHAIDLHRVDDVRFAVAAFTNLTQDHLDYHHTIEEYLAVKRRLLTDLDVEHRVVDIDNAPGAEMAEALRGVVTVGRSDSAHVRASALRLLPTGSRFTLHTGGRAVEVSLPLVGLFNVDNALVAAGCAHALGIPLDAIAEGLSNAPQVPGRLERIEAGQPFGVFVDYAHTPDGLQKAIEAVRGAVSGRVIVVFGCGGDRDPEKRPMMGAAVASAADHAIVTSDNPRSEDAVGIILQIEDGLRDAGMSYEVEVDRRTAIALALGQADDGDGVLIAGKGHEDYQVFADRTIHFDDREVTREELARLC